MCYPIHSALDSASPEQPLLCPVTQFSPQWIPEPLYCSMTQSSPQWNSRTAVLLNDAVQSTVEFQNRCVAHCSPVHSGIPEPLCCSLQSSPQWIPEPLYCSTTQSSPQWNSRTAVLLIVVQSTVEFQNRCVAHCSPVHNGSREPLYCSMTQSSPQWNSRTAVLLIAVQSTTEVENHCIAQKLSLVYIGTTNIFPPQLQLVFPGNE